MMVRKIAVERGAFVLRQLLPQVAADVPLREQFQFAPQQRLVIGRQHARARCELPPQQRVDRVAKQVIRVVGVERAQVGGRPEVGQQQEAALDVLRQDLRRVHSRFVHQRCDVHERPAVLARRRRVHRDQCLRSGRQRMRRPQCHAEVAAKACILGRGRQRERLRLQHLAPATRRGGGSAGRRREGSSNEVGLGCERRIKPGRKSRRASVPDGHRHIGLGTSVGLECFILANRLWLHS